MIGEFAIDGPLLVIPGRAALLLVRALKIEEVRVAVRGSDATGQVDAVLSSWLEVVQAERLRRLQNFAGSDCGTELAQSVPQPSSSAVMTTADVAQLHGVTTRTIRKAAAKGSLRGVRYGRGWTFAPDDVALWRAEVNHE